MPRNNKRLLLYRSSWRYHLQHPLQLLFSILGVALGVAMVVAIDMASHSARQGFYLSTQSIAGNASHRIVNSDNAIPEAIYTQLRTHVGVQKIAPLIKQTVRFNFQKNSLPDKQINDPLKNPLNESQDMQLTGIDPFSEAEIRTWQQGMIETLSGDNLQRLLTEPNTVLLETGFLQQHNLRIGDKLSLQNKSLQRLTSKSHANNTGQPIQLSIIGHFKAPEVYQSQLTNWLICDISTAQELLNYQGYISQIDLSLDTDNMEMLEKIKTILPEGIQLLQSDEHAKAIVRLSQSFDLNLTALSLLGLLVAMFLIYNTMMFSVVQRRDIMARMRVLGVSRKELFRLVIVEAFFIAILATGAGFLIAMGVAQVLLHLVTRTINDLYYVLQVTQLQWNYLTVLKALFLGVGATLLSALIPALEAAYTRPVQALQRSDLEAKIMLWSRWLVLPGLLGCLVVYYLMKAQIGGIVAGFASVFLLIIALICLLPIIALNLLPLLAIMMKRLFLLPGKMAVNNIAHSFSRSIVAIAALTVSVSAALGIGIMVDSFRFTVDDWLLGYLKADYYITTSGNGSSDPSGSLVNNFAKHSHSEVSQLSGVHYVSSNQDVSFFIDGHYHQLNVLDIPPESFTAFRLKEGHFSTAKKAWFEEDAVIISEPYAYRNGLSVGDSISLPISLNNKQNEQKSFRIAGIYYHYGSEHGVITMSRTTYNRYWKGRKIKTLGLYLEDTIQQDQSKRERFEKHLKGIIRDRPLQLISRQDVHQSSLLIFDRTFKITHVIKLLVILVSFVGILSALMAIELERAREFAILRATGLTGKQLSALVYIETFTMGLIAAVLAMPMGIVLAYLLIEVVNYRSFGWSMQFILPWEEFAIAGGLAISAALLAAIYPAWHLSKTQAALALRGE